MSKSSPPVSPFYPLEFAPTYPQESCYVPWRLHESVTAVSGQPRLISCNHFDIDGFLAVFAALRLVMALKHAELLETAAKIGDFRQLDLDLRPSWIMSRLSAAG